MKFVPKNSLPTTALMVGGEPAQPCRQLDGYVSTAPRTQRVHVRRRTIPLGSRLMRMAIARYEDHKPANLER